jgi:hypothetical protein
VEAPFQQWGLDFIGQFKDNSSNGYTWIIRATDYFTKWVEAILTKSATRQSGHGFSSMLPRYGYGSARFLKSQDLDTAGKRHVQKI